MKISARNFLKGKIKEVRKGATTAHVEIELKGGETVISSITNEAVEERGLKIGTKAYVVIKASAGMAGAIWPRDRDSLSSGLCAGTQPG